MDDIGKDSIVTTPSTTSLWAKLGLMAASVAAIGAVCGAFYLGTVFSSPPIETKSVAATETTGSAPAKDNVPKQETQAAASEPAPVEAADAANCREQTWPYIARPCLAHEKALANAKSERGVRVISTDKLADPVVGMVETPPDVVINRKTAPPEPPKTQAAAPVPAAANSSASAEAPSLKSGASLGAVAISPAAAAPAQTPEPVVAASTPPAEPPAQSVVAPATPQPAVQATAAVEPQAAPEKRSEKYKRKAAKRPDERFKESERFKTVTAQSDDEDDEPVVEKKSGRIKGRVVERWTERDYNVPSYDRGGTRRVIVTDRDDTDRERSISTERGGGFPNIFGAIFGGN
jgi:hypothetical protein